jgi:hypothetical protein
MFQISDHAGGLFETTFYLRRICEICSTPTKSTSLSAALLRAFAMVALPDPRGEKTIVDEL